MTHLEDLVAAIENKNTSEVLREDYISKLNIYGYNEEQIEAEAYRFWTEYFEQNMEEILVSKQSIESHLLNQEVVKKCFEERFEEFRNRKKHLGIDDIQKFWSPI